MEFPENSAVSSLPQTPLIFTAKVTGIYLPGARVLEPWAVQSGLGLGSLAPKVSLPICIHRM